MTKEQILEQHLKLLLNDRPGSYKEISKMKGTPEWNVVLNAMEEYANMKLGERNAAKEDKQVETPDELASRLGFPPTGHI